MKKLSKKQIWGTLGLYLILTVLSAVCSLAFLGYSFRLIGINRDLMMLNLLGFQFFGFVTILFWELFKLFFEKYFDFI